MATPSTPAPVSPAWDRATNATRGLGRRYATRPHRRGTGLHRRRHPPGRPGLDRAAQRHASAPRHRTVPPRDAGLAPAGPVRISSCCASPAPTDTWPSSGRGPAPPASRSSRPGSTARAPEPRPQPAHVTRRVRRSRSASASATRSTSSTATPRSPICPHCSARPRTRPCSESPATASSWSPRRATTTPARSCGSWSTHPAAWPWPPNRSSWACWSTRTRTGVAAATAALRAGRRPRHQPVHRRMPAPCGTPRRRSPPSTGPPPRPAGRSRSCDLHQRPAPPAAAHPVAAARRPATQPRAARTDTDAHRRSR